jgi:hypothetical protein
MAKLEVYASSGEVEKWVKKKQLDLLDRVEKACNNSKSIAEVKSKVKKYADEIM